ncbi:MAG: hypothetical protein MSA13_04305, partial [Prevotella sp.]|nr:hypothetical protein [Prevotella sp.]
MKLKLMTMALSIALAASSCSSSNDPIDPDSQDTPQDVIEEEPLGETLNVSGSVSGTWTKNSTVNVTGHLTVPQGQSLTIEEGVKVIFTSAGVGVNHVPVEFTVDGNLYIKGTAENPVLLSTEESQRTADNVFAGLWGGIVASATCDEMLIDHAIIEYTGGAVIEGSPAATAGVYTAGDDAYPQITTNNVNG